MYSRILVPTDGSAGSMAATEHAIELARMHDATIRALYVVNETALAGASVEVPWEGLYAHLKEEGAKALEAVTELAENADVPCETAIREGRPSKLIVDEAVESGCDLIVMGTHGRSGLDRILLGSVAERVIRTSPVPVMTVRMGID
ncbi:MAG: universal stress protein [Halobacteriota archaeon]